MPANSNQTQLDTRFRVLRLLADDPEISQRALARAVGISAGSAHYVLKSLIEMGFVKLGNFTAAEDKRRYAYILTPIGLSEKASTTKRFLARKIAEHEVLQAEIDALRREVGDSQVVPAKSANE